MTGARRCAWPRLWDAATLPHKENYLVVERVFQTQGDARDLTLRRPSYKTFRNIAAKVSVLLQVDPEAMLAAPEFEQVLQACTVENISDWLGECDYQEAVALWDAIMEHCEFSEFFEARQRQHFEASKARAEMDVMIQAAQIEAMKNSGLLPPDYSLADMMDAGIVQSLTPMTPPSSSTTTPADTVGPESKSNARTSGTSSATTQKQPAAAKRKPN